MKKSKKFFVSALFSVLGTIGLAGCDMGSNTNSDPSSQGDKNAFLTAINSETFKSELKGVHNTGGLAMEATFSYFKIASMKNKVFIKPKNFDKFDANWENITVTDATYIKTVDGDMIGLVSVSISGIFDNPCATTGNYLYAVEVATDGTIIRCDITEIINLSIWNVLNDQKIKKSVLDKGLKYSAIDNRVFSVVANASGKLYVGETSKEDQHKGFSKFWVMDGKVTVLADDAKVFNLVFSDGRVISVE